MKLGAVCMYTTFKLSACGLTDTGIHRSNNEDSLLVHIKAGAFLVADGMGGAAAGEIASRIFVDTARQTVSQQQDRTEDLAAELVKNVFLTANSRIRTHIQKQPKHNGMGCTAELLIIHELGFVLGHIGDSRTYRLRGSRLSRLTRDHSLIQDQIDQGIISRQEARTHRLRNVIIRAVGVDDQLEIDLIKGRFADGDIFLLCSDGLTDMIEEEAINTTLLIKGSLIDRASSLIEQANKAGGRDNISVVLLEVKT